jgi:hypothetical protein
LLLQAEQEIRHFTQKLHVQIENKPQSPQSETYLTFASFPAPIVSAAAAAVRAAEAAAAAVAQGKDPEAAARITVSSE